ncbi:hypothetical protein YC2023_011908 [Brassica napus]
MGMVGYTVALVVITVIASPCVYGKQLSDQQEIKVQRLLKRLNKPALKSIKSEDGDIIDCVPITKQPAFDHPLLKNHTIQMRPSFVPEGGSTFTKKEAKAITQVWHKNGVCPNNTVPIRRTKKEDILRAKSIESFGKKRHKSFGKGTHQSNPGEGHENQPKTLLTRSSNPHQYWEMPMNNRDAEASMTKLTTPVVAFENQRSIFCDLKYPSSGISRGCQNNPMRPKTTEEKPSPQLSRSKAKSRTRIQS